MLKLLLTAVFFTDTLALHKIDHRHDDPAPNIDNSIKFRISHPLSNSICDQRRQFASSRSVQPPQKRKPYNIENLSPCISFFKMKEKGLGMLAMCDDTQVIKPTDPRYTQMPVWAKGERSSSDPVPCTGPPPNNGNSARSGLKNQTRLWKYKDDLCFMPIIYRHCYGSEGSGSQYECNIHFNIIRALNYLSTHQPNLYLYYILSDILPNKDPNIPDYVVIEPQFPSCSSADGRMGGFQSLFVQKGCNDMKSILHEISHSMGINHEHERFDRDQYITVNYDNVRPDDLAKGNFDIEKTDEWEAFGIPYNQHSIMHYGPKDGSKNNKDTITAKDGGTVGDGDINQKPDLELRRKLYESCKKKK